MTTSEVPIDAKEAAAMLGIDRRSVVRLARTGKVPGFKVGDSTWRFYRSEILAYIQEHRSRPGDTLEK